MGKKKKLVEKIPRYVVNSMLPTRMGELLESGDYRSFAGELDEQPTSSKFTTEIKEGLQCVGKVDRLELWIASISIVCVFFVYLWLR